MYCTERYMYYDVSVICVFFSIGALVAMIRVLHNMHVLSLAYMYMYKYTLCNARHVTLTLTKTKQRCQQLKHPLDFLKSGRSKLH